MIVVDASVMVEWLLRTPAGALIGRRVAVQSETLHAPHLLDIEVAQALKRYRRSGMLDNRRLEEAVHDLVTLEIRRYPHTPLLTRVLELRDNLSAYDAVYVALAESLHATLLTRDGKLASAPGHRARVQLV